MDVHKESIDIAQAEEGMGEVRHYGKIAGDLLALARVVRKLVASGARLIFVYEPARAASRFIAGCRRRVTPMLGSLARAHAKKTQ
jgi:hypothetical protein